MITKTTKALILSFLAVLVVGRGVIGCIEDVNRSKSLSEPLELKYTGSELYFSDITPNYQDSRVLASNNHHETSKDLIKKHFPREVWSYAEAVMVCESNRKRKAVNWEYHKAGNCYGSFGLFQISCNNFSGSYEKMFDLETNIKKAAELYEKRGFQPWANCP